MKNAARASRVLLFLGSPGGVVQGYRVITGCARVLYLASYVVCAHWLRTPDPPPPPPGPGARLYLLCVVCIHVALRLGEGGRVVWQARVCVYPPLFRNLLALGSAKLQPRRPRRSSVSSVLAAGVGVGDDEAGPLSMSSRPSRSSPQSSQPPPAISSSMASFSAARSAFFS